MNRHEFENLTLPHLDAVHRMAMQLARHADDAADLVQETYLKALGAAKRFREQGGGARPWLFKILHNVFYARIGKAKRSPIVMGELRETATEHPGPGEPEPAWDLTTMDWEQVDQRLEAAIEQLRPEYRTVLLLWGVEGMKYRQIAEIEDIPMGTVVSRLHRARRTLAARLGCGRLGPRPRGMGRLSRAHGAASLAVRANPRHPPQTDGLDLSPRLSRVDGSGISNYNSPGRCKDR